MSLIAMLGKMAKTGLLIVVSTAILFLAVQYVLWRDKPDDLAEQFNSNDAEKSHVGKDCDNTSTALQILKGRNLVGRYIIVTGANSGLGFEASRALAMSGAHVVLACRNVQKCEKARVRIVAESPEAIAIHMVIDLKSLESVRNFANVYKSNGWPLHAMILNAGVTKFYENTTDGFDTTFQVNYLAQFYLTQLFRDLLMASRPSRIVFVGSEAHTDVTFLDAKALSIDSLSFTKSNYDIMYSYAVAKLCCVIAARHLNKLWAPQGVTSYSLDPGSFIATNIARHVDGFDEILEEFGSHAKSVVGCLLLKTQGAATLVYLAATPGLEDFGGEYFQDNCISQSSKVSRDPELSDALWNVSMKLLRDRGYI